LWFHVGLVGLGGTKMSKSLGNLVFVGDLCKEWDPAAVRLALADDLDTAAALDVLDWEARADRSVSDGPSSWARRSGGGKGLPTQERGESPRA